METKRYHVIDLYTDLGDEDTEYRAVQIRSTESFRGGMIALIKLELQVETAEAVRIHSGDEFAQAIVLTDKSNKAYIGWYNSPLMSTESFGETIHRLCTDYDTQIVVGDFNARHPRWCHAHDRHKRGAQLLKLTHDLPEMVIHAPPAPTFAAIKNKRTGALRTSTVDLLLSRVYIPCLTTLSGYVHVASDHKPIIFKIGSSIEKRKVPRRVPKTLLQSTRQQQDIGLWYEVALNEPLAKLNQCRPNTTRTPEIENEKHVHNAYDEAREAITDPWLTQVRQRRRGSRPHVTNELRRLWDRKKRLYDRMRWKPTESNKKKYKDMCAQAQWRERQLQREQKRRLQQRIQKDPASHMAKALQLSAQKRARQLALDTTAGKLLRPKQFATYLNHSMTGANSLVPVPFTVDLERHEQNTVLAIQSMENNKAIGTDGVHVEMLKANKKKAAKLLTGIWHAVGRCAVVPKEWLEGITVPLFKGKGSQMEPANYRPLTILSHIRKITEKAVVLELDKQINTDDAQYGFLSGVQVIQAALRVLAALKHTATFLAVLDLAKAYDSIIKQLLLEKLRKLVDHNLANQLLIFLLSVHSTVAGDITGTRIKMDKGLTQGGTSSPALFRMFINDLPQEVRDALHAQGKVQEQLDPLCLVADDVVGLTQDTGALQVVLDACQKWADANKLTWNPRKSQILCTTAKADTMEAEIHLGGTTLKWVDEVEYLGLRLSKDGFLGKNPTEVEGKCNTALHLLMQEEWFTLDLEPKHLIREFISRVRSQLMYGSELLSYEARKPFIDIDRRVVNRFITQLLKLGKTRPLHLKHQLRIQIALGIPLFEMAVDQLVKGRVETWVTRRTSNNKNIESRASKSLVDILKLNRNHPLRVALSKIRPTSNRTVEDRQLKWQAMRDASRGTKRNPEDRQLVASHTLRVAEEETVEPGFVEEPTINGELRKAAMRWSIYRFPVKYEPTPTERGMLAWLPKWQTLTREKQAEATDNLLAVYNAEEKMWNRVPLESHTRADIRSQNRVGGHELN